MGRGGGTKLFTKLQHFSIHYYNNYNILTTNIARRSSGPVNNGS